MTHRAAPVRASTSTCSGPASRRSTARATLADHVAHLHRRPLGDGFVVEHLQSNHEGDPRRAPIHGARGRCAAIVINPAAFTHYAWALHGALAAFDGKVVEVHLSNPPRREAVAPPLRSSRRWPTASIVRVRRRPATAWRAEALEGPAVTAACAPHGRASAGPRGCGRGARGRRRRAAGHASWSTSAGSPASPGRPASPLVRDDRRPARHRRPLPETQAAEQVGADVDVSIGRTVGRADGVAPGRHQRPADAWPSRPTP